MSVKRQTQSVGKRVKNNQVFLLIVVFGMIALFVSPYIFPGDIYSPDIDLEDYGTVHVFYNVMSGGVPGWTAEVQEGASAYDADSNFNMIGISHLRVLGEAGYINEDIEGMLYCKDTGQKLGTSPMLVMSDIIYGDYMYWAFPRARLLAGEHTYYVVLYGMYDNSHSIGAQTIDFDIDYSGVEILAEPTVVSEDARYSVTTGEPVDIVFLYANLWDDASWKIVVDGDSVDDFVAAHFDGEDHEVVFVFTAKTAKIFDITFVMEFGTVGSVRTEVQVVATGEDVVTTTTTTTTTNATTTTNSTTTGTTNSTTTGSVTDWEGYIEELERQMEELTMLLVATVAVFAAVLVVLMYSGRRRR